MSIPNLLDGIRILDLTRVWAGPLATRILADLGAEVIKIEAPTGRTPGGTPRVGGRLSPKATPGSRPWNIQGTFNKLNRNKLSLVLDLSQPEGIEVFLGLVAISDVVVENFSTGVMSRLGLGYDRLREANPRIIMIRMPGFGTEGPYTRFPSYGNVLEPTSGITSLMGYPNEQPFPSGLGYPDPVGALHSAAATLTALMQRSITGAGQWIDISQLEASITMIGELFVNTEVTGVVPPRIGDRHPHYAPQGCYQCEGDDKWVVLTIRSEEEWAKLCSVMKRPDLIEDARFGDRSLRMRNHDELDFIITNWTKDQENTDVMKSLQEERIPCGAVLSAHELLTDENLNARGFFVHLDEPEAGAFPYPGLPITVDGHRRVAWAPAPLFGQHNQQILRALLGLSDAQIGNLN